MLLLTEPLIELLGRNDAQHSLHAVVAELEMQLAIHPGVETGLVILRLSQRDARVELLNAGMPAYSRAISHVSTRGLGFAFAANTLVIVLLQLVVLQRIEGRRRTRVIVVMSAIWATSWALLGGSGISPGTLGATFLVAGLSSLALPGLALGPLDPAGASSPVTAKVDLSLVLWEDSGRIEGAVEYATALFERETVERWVGYLRRVLEGMVADDTQPVDRLALTLTPLRQPGAQRPEGRRPQGLCAGFRRI